MKKYNTVIIGSGASGLSSALILAKNGRDVAIFEQYRHAAPLLRRFKRGHLWCDPGFHYSGGLDKNGPLSVLLRYLGIYDQLAVLPLPAEGFDYLQFGREKIYRMPYGFDALKEYLSDHFPDSLAAIRAYFDYLTFLRKNTGYLNFELDLAAYPEKINAKISLAEFLRTHGANPGLVRLLGDHGRVLYGVAAEEVPLYIHAFIMGSFYRHASTLVRGGDALVDAFIKELRKYNVDVYCQKAVSKIRISERTVRGITCEDGQEFSCDNVISTIHPQLLTDLLPPEGIKPAFRKRLTRLQNTGAPFILFYEIDPVPEALQKTNYYVFPQNERADECGYLAYMAANQQAELQGRKSLSVIRPCAPREISQYFSNSAGQAYHALKVKIEAETDAAFRRQFPEIDGTVKLLNSASPRTLNHYTRTVDGSIYGVKQSVHQTNPGTLAPVHGLYLAGQSIMPGVMGAVVSAFMACNHIVDSNKLVKSLREHI